MESKTYLTSYCNKPHRVSDGKPIAHECRILPVKALQLEMLGDYPGSQRILSNQKHPKHMLRGVKAP